MNSHISPKIGSLKWNNEINESDCMQWFMRLHHEKMAAKMEFRIEANSYAWPFNCTYIYIYPTRTDPTNFRSLCLLEPMIWVVIVFQKTPLLLLIEEILHHLGCLKPYETVGHYEINSLQNGWHDLLLWGYEFLFFLTSLVSCLSYFKPTSNFTSDTPKGWLLKGIFLSNIRLFWGYLCQIWGGKLSFKNGHLWTSLEGNIVFQTSILAVQCVPLAFGGILLSAGDFGRSITTQMVVKKTQPTQTASTLGFVPSDCPVSTSFRTPTPRIF